MHDSVDDMLDLDSPDEIETAVSGRASRAPRYAEGDGIEGEHARYAREEVLKALQADSR